MPHKDKKTRSEFMRKYQKEWLRKRKLEYFKGSSCVQCGSTEKLEIHHVDPAQKVTHRIWSNTIDKRNEELSKCTILCHDCHKDLHIQLNAPKHGTNSRYTSQRWKCRCSECTEAHRLKAQEYKRAKL